MYLDPLPLNCPHCAAHVELRTDDLLDLTARCPACGKSLDSIGRRMGRSGDDWTTFVTWIEVLMEVEELLGIAKPGIPDPPNVNVWANYDITLRDMVAFVVPHVPPGTPPLRTVLQGAQRLAENNHTITEADLALPLLRALGVRHWASRFDEAGSAATPTTP